ncbi:uncharacterized protein TrAFT101_005030 [Trichoderma asperellum]|uniref:uncharacterized protein n=1 Tax=Trichoderma asperellum TaxID=101201 RepID=UPI00332D9C3E|nr:hypothetical protein TrAFT101_005030 [Trichoderma asperellum]
MPRWMRVTYGRNGDAEQKASIRKRPSKGHKATQSGVIVIAASISGPLRRFLYEDSGARKIPLQAMHGGRVADIVSKLKPTAGHPQNMLRMREEPCGTSRPRDAVKMIAVKMAVCMEQCDDGWLALNILRVLHPGCC